MIWCHMDALIRDRVTIETVREDWRYKSNICNHKKSYNIKVRWVENTKDPYDNNEPQMYEEITIEDINHIIKRLHKWKSHGIDKINFWLNN